MIDLFDRIRAEGMAAIEDAVASKQTENLQLDFKQKGDPAPPRGEIIKHGAQLI